MSRDKETGPGGGSGRSADTWAIDAHHYWAFLSYSHADSVDADWLHQAIERFTMPKGLVGRITATGAVPKKLSPIFRDRHELAASSDLGGKIRSALKQSRFLIVLCSPAAAGSRWVNEEILAFKKLHGERRILAAIVGGEPWASEIAGREAEECFPPALRERIDRKGHSTGKRAEPIAADLRETRDGREAGKLKLVAGMLGLGLDDLVRREAQRRQRRLKMVVAASIAGMTVTSGLAVFAFDKRDEARDQRREAEGLVGFMLGDLRDELEPIGKLSALDAVGKRTLAYFEHQDKTELSDAALAQRSHALNLLGQIATSRLDPHGALLRYREAMRSTAELVDRSPNDPQRLFDHAQNIFYIGDIDRKRGDARQAEVAYRAYAALAERMVAIDPTNPKWRMEVLYANENLGIVLLDQRRFAEAVRQIEGSIRPMRSGGEVAVRTPAYQKELSTLFAWLADAEAYSGRLLAATAIRREQITFLNRLITNGSTDVNFREHLIPAFQALGILLTKQGQTQAGLAELQRAVDEASTLLPIEPDNAIWTGLSAQARLQLATAKIDLDRARDAGTDARVGCDQMRHVMARDPGAYWRPLRTTCFSVLGRLAAANHNPAGALRLAEQALASAQSERDSDPIKVRYQIAASYRLVGDIYRQSGNADRARQMWAAGLGQLPAGVAERPREMNERAQLLRRLGRNDAARRLDQRLNQIGYRNHS